MAYATHSTTVPDPRRRSAETTPGTGGTRLSTGAAAHSGGELLAQPMRPPPTPAYAGETGGGPGSVIGGLDRGASFSAFFGSGLPSRPDPSTPVPASRAPATSNGTAERPTLIGDPVRVASEITAVIKPTIDAVESRADRAHTSAVEALAHSKAALRAISSLESVVKGFGPDLADRAKGILIAIDRFERSVQRDSLSRADVQKSVAEELGRNNTALLNKIGPMIVKALAPQFAGLRVEFDKIKGDVFRIRNEARFTRELLVRFADMYDSSQQRRTKKGAVRSQTLISQAVHGAAPYLRPRVSLTGNERDPLRLLFRLEMQEDRQELAAALAAMEDEESPLTSPEYELEDGEVDSAPAASSSTSSGI